MVEYLFTLKTPVLGMDSWHIVGPFDNGADDAGWTSVFPPEKGIDLKATYDGKGGKVAWRTVQAGRQGYVDLQAFFAPNSNEIVSYLYREIESPADQDATILLGTRRRRQAVGQRQAGVHEPRPPRRRAGTGCGEGEAEKGREHGCCSRSTTATATTAST